MEKNIVVRKNAKQFLSFNESKFNPVTVYTSKAIKVILAYFKQGQYIPVHTPGIDVVLCILDGEAEVVAGEKRMISGKNDVIVVPRGMKRGVKALTDLSVVHVVTPPPSEENHREVHQKLEQGRFE